MIRVLIVALALLVALPATAQVIPGTRTADTGDQATAELPPPSPNDLRELMRLLADPSVQDWLRKSAQDDAAAPAPAADRSPRAMFEDAVAAIGARASLVGRALRSLPELPATLAEEWTNGISPAQKVRGLTLLVIFVFVGAGLEWLYRRTVHLTLLRLEQTPQAGPMGRVVSAAQRAALIFAGLAIFAAGSIGTFVAFDWPPMVRTMILDALVVLLLFRVILSVSLFFQAPYAPALRLVPWSTAMARAVHGLIFTFTATIMALCAAYFFFDRIAQFNAASRDLTQPLIAASVVLAAAVLLTVWAAILWAGWWLPRCMANPDALVRRRWRIWQAYLMALALVAFLAWLLGAQGLMWLIVVFGPLPLGLRAVRMWIDHFFDQSTEAQLADHRARFEVALERFRQQAEQIADPEERAALVEPDMPQMEDPHVVSRPIVQRAVRFLLILGSLFAFAALWGVGVTHLSTEQSLLGRGLKVVFDSIVVLLIADLIWTWARTVIDKRLADYVPPEGSEAPGPEARMITLLPLFRTTILVVLLSVVGLSILTSLGINIAPLLAGAGILGIAIGFGTQSLVRDIVSGLFFLIDDAFRVGEYIEVGELMGTVESISVRSMRIRHHRGKVHTVPYGELKSVTNHSRDWVIMKLEFRVPFDTDLNLVKKLIKKVGAELQENEFYGHAILQTLKSQGVRRMEEFNMVVGVKFMTKPGEQWLVRRDAYQKVRDIFDANGIRLAERNVRVEIDRDPASLTEDERRAIAAAAQQAVERPDGPPVPVPDEP